MNIKNAQNSENSKNWNENLKMNRNWKKLNIPAFTSFFDSSKFFLNLFAACLIFTEVHELVFYYFSYSQVQLRFEPTLQFATLQFAT